MMFEQLRERVVYWYSVEYVEYIRQVPCMHPVEIMYVKYIRQIFNTLSASGCPKMEANGGML